ncbi:MAG: DUF1922 domain-containing protein [Methanomassiliicoccales archaeon]|nr:MAG: DUF1922 domain-containing protein [Methanomassiliicoccales archaeon]
MYGVVVCSRCRKATGVDLRNKTARCQCGNQIRLKEAKKFFESDSQREIAAAVGRLNAELSGGTEEWEKIAGKSDTVDTDDPYSEIVVSASSVTDRKEKLTIAVRGLSDALGGFTTEDLEKVLQSLGMKNAEDCLRLLLEENIIYEPRKNVFRAV